MWRGRGIVLTAAVASLCLACLSITAQAAIVEAEQWTNVIVEAPLYDSQMTTGGGCDPAGCLGMLTRDGDSVTPESRWSCSPSLGPIGSVCHITFEMKKKLDIKGLRVAVHEGNSGAKATMMFFVNGEFALTWTSSGETAGFEYVPLVARKVHHIELRGVLSRTEWINIAEVEILTESVHDEKMMQAAMEVAMNDAIDYHMKIHAFHAGRPRPPTTSQVTLVTQCSADRLGAVRQQALKWGGDVSLAVLVPSAPVWETAQALEGVRQLAKDIDQEWKSDPKMAHLSVDIAVLEGAERDSSKQDHCGPLYPVNTLRNLALLQTRNEALHPAPTVFLVDSDFVPSITLRAELGLPDVQRRLLDGVQEPARKHVSSVPSLDISSAFGTGGVVPRHDEHSPLKRVVIAVVPCLEFVDGISDIEEGKVPIPNTPDEAADLFAQGFVRGFHVHRVAASHAPTDFERWALETRNATGGGLAYTIPYYPRFEPYVAVAKKAVPLYDERFRGYANNKLAHILALALGGYPNPPHYHSATGASGLSSMWDTMNTLGSSPDSYGVDSDDSPRAKRAWAEFVVVRRGFVFHQPHPASPAWEATYGGDRDALRAYQIRHLWLTFLMEVRAGVPPAISASTENLMLAMRIQNPPLARVLGTPRYINVDEETGNDVRWLAFRRDASYLIGGQRRIDLNLVDIDAMTGAVSISRSKVNGGAIVGAERDVTGGHLLWTQWLRTLVCILVFLRVMLMGRARWCSS